MALTDGQLTGIGAGVNAASGLLGGGISAIANRRAQKRAIKFAREQMAWNANEAQKNRDFQKKMFDDTNEWNSAYSQRKRLEAAGLNPYLMLDGGSAGTASSASGDSASYSSMPNFSPPDLSAVTNGLSSAGDKISNFAMQRAEIRARNAKSNIDEIDGLTRGLRNLSEIGVFNSQRDKNILERQMTEFMLDFNRDIRQTRIDSERERLKILQSQAAHEAVTLAMSEIDLVNYPEQKRLELEQLSSTIYNAYASGYLSYKQAEAAVAQKLYLDAQAEGQRISNKVARETAGSLIAYMIAENRSNQGYYMSDPNGGETNMYPDWNGDWKSFDKLSPTRQAFINGQQRGIRDHLKQYSRSSSSNYSFGSDNLGHATWGYNDSETYYR